MSPQPSYREGADQPVGDHDRLAAELESAMAGADAGLTAADRLCVACVDLLDVDGAAISLMHEGETRGTFGSSGVLSRRLDEFQFTYGEGPCLDAVAAGSPVLVSDVGHSERRWPAYSPAVLGTGVRGVFALPVAIARSYVGVLDLFRHEPGPLTEPGLFGGLLAAKLAALPLLNLMNDDVDWSTAADGGTGWSHLASLERVEVYQATGMIMEQLGVTSTDALVRLRAHAYASGRTASEVAWAIVERRLALDADDGWGPARPAVLTVRPDREREVSAAFVSLANSLVDGVDVMEVLIGLTADCARLLDIASAGLLLADEQRELHVVAASSEATRTLELFQLQRDQGPCLDCFRSGAPVSVADIASQAERWPTFVEAALALGFASVHAVPMRMQENVLGALGLFGTTVGALSEDDLSLAQALAHVASVAILQNKIVSDASAVAEQLQNALSSRVVLEQAKGAVAQRGNLGMDQSFEALRTYARDHNQRLADVAAAVVARRLPAQALLDHARARGTRSRPPTD